jgi:hypothetical protein
MTQRTSSIPPVGARPRGRARRVKRGIVAGYIHEISQRHAGPVSLSPAPRRAAPASRLGAAAAAGCRDAA